MKLRNIRGTHGGLPIDKSQVNILVGLCNTARCANVESKAKLIGETIDTLTRSFVGTSYMNAFRRPKEQCRSCLPSSDGVRHGIRGGKTNRGFQFVGDCQVNNDTTKQRVDIRLQLFIGSLTEDSLLFKHLNNELIGEFQVVGIGKVILGRRKDRGDGGGRSTPGQLLQAEFRVPTVFIVFASRFDGRELHHPTNLSNIAIDPCHSAHIRLGCVPSHGNFTRIIARRYRVFLVGSNLTAGQSQTTKGLLQSLNQGPFRGCVDVQGHCVFQEVRIDILITRSYLRQERQGIELDKIRGFPGRIILGSMNQHLYQNLIDITPQFLDFISHFNVSDIVDTLSSLNINLDQFELGNDIEIDEGLRLIRSELIESFSNKLRQIVQKVSGITIPRHLVGAHPQGRRHIQCLLSRRLVILFTGRQHIVQGTIVRHGHIHGQSRFGFNVGDIEEKQIIDEGIRVLGDGFSIKESGIVSFLCLSQQIVPRHVNAVHGVIAIEVDGVETEGLECQTGVVDAAVGTSAGVDTLFGGKIIAGRPHGADIAC